MMPTANIFFFGDQSVEPYDSLIDLIHEIPNSDLLGTFLRSCFDALQASGTCLPLEHRCLFQGRDFAQLVDHVQALGVRDAAIASVLSCVAQLGWLLIHREHNRGIWLQAEHTAVGICTGGLAALVAVTALSTGDVLHLGPVMVAISLRLGFEVSRRSYALDASPGSWSVGVSGVSLKTVEHELRQFHGSRLLPDVKHIYVSAHSASSVTLSGPPTLLREFISSEALRSSRRLTLPIYGAYHAKHLSLPDLDYIMGDSPLLERPVACGGLLLRARIAQTQSFRELLRLTLQDILQQPIDIDEQIQDISHRVATLNVDLTSIGPARMSSLERALKPNTVCRFGSRQLQSDQINPHPLNTSESIAVVGMAGRFPGAEDVDELWKALIGGKDQHRLIPIERFDIKSHVDHTGKTNNTSLTPYGCFYDGVGNFDIALFKMSPREAAQTDPMQRLMLLTAYEALEAAGYYDTGDLSSRPKNGTFYGVAADDYRQANSSQDVDINYITGGTRAFGPGRVSYYFGWEGPSMSVDTACSASAVAMHQAITSLRRKECDVALSGGANLLTCSDMFAGLSRARFVNKTGPCKTFDETADGYCRADGFASVVFKRLDDAIRDKDNILGVIRSVETNHAGTAISLTHPEADTQIALFRSVLSTAGMTIDDVDHIELHGTGTQAGDLAESTSVAGLLNKPRPKHRPLTISSVKPNVGHSEAASGVTSLIKGLLMLQHQTIPRHIGIKTRINPKLPAFGDLGVVVPQDNMYYPALAKDGKRRMLVNNFNATGGITAMLLEEYNETGTPSAIDSRTHHPITLSAATPEALRNILMRLLDYIHNNLAVNLSHLSYTLTARRLHHKYRFACVVQSVDELLQMLKVELETTGAKRLKTPLSVFVCTGQASALPRAQVLFETNATFRRHICHSDQLCRKMDLPSFIEVIANEGLHFGSAQLQLALVALEIALAALFESWGIRPEAVIGHSLGEYAALCICNVLSLADTLWLVGKRGLLLESACRINEYTMAVVAISADEAAKLLQVFPQCEIACSNSPQQTVFSGKVADIDSLMSHLASVNVKATKLQTSYGYHSRQMDSILEDYQKIAQGVSFQKHTITFISSLLGEAVADESKLCADYLCRQTREPVLFEKGLHEVQKLIGSDQKAFWIELGPAPACLPMIASTLQVESTALAAILDPKKSNWATVSRVLSMYYAVNGSVRWDEYHKEYLDCLRLLQLPSYPFDLKRYWIQYDGDWMIRKNQKLLRDDVLPSSRAKLESSTLHRVESDLTERGVRKLTFSTDLDGAELKDLLQRFKIGGDMFVPSSIFVDMAMTAAAHLHERLGVTFKAMGVLDLELPLGCPSGNLSSLRTVAMQLLNDSNEVRIAITMYECDERIELARCRVLVSDGEDWESEANGNAYLYHSRMDVLQFLMANGHTSCIVGTDISPYIAYDRALPSIKEVILSTKDLEAVGKLHILPGGGDYKCNPVWLEALIQLATITLNHEFKSRHDCHGWGKMQYLMPLVPGDTYNAHIRLEPRGLSGKKTGDIHVMSSSGHVVIVIKRLVFRSSEKNTSTTPSARQTHRAHYVPAVNHPESVGQSSLTENSRQTAILLEEKHGNDGIESNFTADSHGMSPKRGMPNKLANSPQASSSADEQKDPRTPISNEGSRVDFEAIIAIVAAEIGVDPRSLTDDIALQDLGVDSIIELSVVARLQEHLSEPLPPAFLMKYNTISKLKEFFSNSVGSM
ncbi:hypothetical protein F5B22DRAFT_325952 [Xylaria bambusicola]|uniref:uncharacterized protein n=1 Tax=Xylaria bambusicola TaxID=326684 RepID=UPI0020087317|nr:uncharacterized protein F5B22DRAFT_325952 [Xylaria bambusicola]KAI0509542.1 hypothetical protein F5B22DRAFT_325952 [Xylaria bambusicola]